MNTGVATLPVSVDALPVNVGAELVPAGVKLAVPFVPAGVKLTVLLVGTPAGHATVPAGVNAAVPLVPVAVVVWVWVPSADPVNVWAVTVRLGDAALQAVAEPVPAAMLVVAQFPLVALAPLVPAGVPPLTALDVIEFPVNVCAGTVPAPPVKAGTPTGHVIVSAGMVPLDPVNVCAGTVPAPPVNVGAATLPAGVYEFIVSAGAEFVPAGVPADTALDVTELPVKVGVETVPAGVIVFDPPLVPTSPLAAMVPMTVNPFRPLISVHPLLHVPLVTKVTNPLGRSDI